MKKWKLVINKWSQKLVFKESVRNLMGLIVGFSSFKYKVKDLIKHITEIAEQESCNFISSLDINLLYIKINLNKTIEICTNDLFENSEIVHRLKKSEFKDLLSLATKDSHFYIAHTKWCGGFPNYS